jgi:hypothetical protein
LDGERSPDCLQHDAIAPDPCGAGGTVLKGYP